MKDVITKYLFIFALTPIICLAQIDKVVFTSEVQIIKPGEISDPITIQTQDSSGNIYQTSETLDVQFVSTSPIGEFLNSSGNPVTTYMSKNTANKTFYYKDSKEGEFQITVNIRGRESGIELTANQPITISSDISRYFSNDSGGEVLSASTTKQETGGSTTNVSSPSSKLEVLAGENRITSPGSPIWFQATIKKNNVLAPLELSWSFGDGYVGVGSTVSHTYKYPGDYVVVLSAKAGDLFSVSRLKVKVFNFKIKVEDKGDYIEISNENNSEINLFNWKIENEGKGFIFQPNTIILPHASIKLDKSLLTLKGYDNSLGISLKNALKEEIFTAAPKLEINTKEIANKLANIKSETDLIRNKIVLNSKLKTEAIILNKEATTTVDQQNIIYKASKSENLFSKLTNFVKRVFSR